MTHDLVTTIRQILAPPAKAKTASAAAPGAVIYLPEIHSVRSGTYFPELRTYDTAKATIVADLASAQHEEVKRVIAVDLTNGKAWDASEEIARAVLDAVLEDEGHIPSWCRDFLEEHLGVNFVMRCERGAA